MSDMEKTPGLRTAFSFFLGLMVTAFIGVGVYTFHGPPTEIEAELRDLNRQEQTIRDAAPPNQLTPDDRSQIRELSDERNRLDDAQRDLREAWGRSTSIILIALATVAMAVSLVRADQLPVISTGLLLGGVFTMLYGIGWSIATDTSMIRFVVLTVALAITLALGYVRFVRRQRARPEETDGQEASGLADLEHRVRGLEARMNDAASALGARRDTPS